MGIALLSNVNLTSVARRASELIGVEIYCPGGGGEWLRELTDPNSAIYGSGPGDVFVILHGRTLLGDNYLAPEDALAPIAESIKTCALDHGEITFAVSTLDIPDSHIRPLTSRKPDLSCGAYWRRALEDIPVPILDLAELAADMGRRSFYNSRVWYMGDIPFSKQGEEALSAEIAAIWRAIHGPRGKCLALDLDNTLWGGEIGELGIDGVHLDKTGSGRRFYDFQRRIAELRENGVLLAILSKNNMDDALYGIDNHPDMLLRSGDFVSIKANWNPKSQNLRELSDELGIPPGAFVFIDDNPLERGRMRMELPEAATPDFPDDSSKMEEFIIDVAHRYFLQADNAGNTAEEPIKAGRCAAAPGQRGEKNPYDGIEDYLRSLGMILSVEMLDTNNLARAAQLIDRINQFNLTGYRYSERELESVMDSPSYRTYVGDLTDRFGEYGSVILCIAYLTDKTDKQAALIDTFLMSRGVMERGVESAFIRAVERDLLSVGVETVIAQYIPGAKNSVAGGFWPGVGYAGTGESENLDGIFKYSLDLPYGGPESDDIIKVVRQ